MIHQIRTTVAITPNGNNESKVVRVFKQSSVIIYADFQIINKILNKYGPLTLPCVVPLFTHFHCPWKVL